MTLTAIQITKAKPESKLKKLSDGHGLQLHIFPNGSKLWRLAYRFDGKQKLLALGAFPDVELKDAREAKDTAKKLLADGVDPNQQKRLDKALKAHERTNTFEAIAGELVVKKRKEGRSQSTITKIEWLLGLANEDLGNRPMTEIKPIEILNVLREIEDKGNYETATRLRSTISEVFRLAIASGRAESDPTRDLRGALITPTVTPRAAIIDPKVFGGLLRAIDGYEGSAETGLALKLLALTFVRPGELRAGEWSEIDLDKKVWTIPASRMKMRKVHKVPLARQSIEILTTLKSITGNGKLMFPSVRSTSRCMSENTLNGALRRLDYTKDEMTAHGFRAAASSILNECGLWNADAIENQLAHIESNAVRKAYARAEYLEERVRMMDYWADKVDEMRVCFVALASVSKDPKQ
jgi:integrase